MAGGRMDVFMMVMTIVLYGSIIGPAFGDDSGWQGGAHATFYGDMGGNETMYGACGYENLFDQGYGLETAALSTALFNDGLTCGACYEIRCVNDPQWCKSGSVVITATNFCPPNYTKTNDIWCNPPQKHFDLSMSVFVKLVTDYHVGVIPVQYRRVSCIKKGGIKFEIKGNPYWILVLVYNVAGAGDVTHVRVKGTNTEWVDMSRNWGQNWETSTHLQKQALSFQVTASDGRMVESLNVAPANWEFGKSYEGKQF